MAIIRDALARSSYGSCAVSAAVFSGMDLLGVATFAASGGIAGKQAGLDFGKPNQAFGLTNSPIREQK